MVSVPTYLAMYFSQFLMKVGRYWILVMSLIIKKYLIE
jgi:hypothetical protein